MIGSIIKISPKLKKANNKVNINPEIKNEKLVQVNYRFGTGASNLLIYQTLKDTSIQFEVTKIQQIKVIGTHNLQVTFTVNSEIYGTTIIPHNDYTIICKYNDTVLGLRNFLTFYPTTIIREYDCKNYDLIENKILFIDTHLSLDNTKFELNGWKYLHHNNNKIILRRKKELLLLDTDLQIIAKGEFKNTWFKINKHYLINSDLEIYDHQFQKVHTITDSGTIFVSNDNIYVQSDTLKIYNQNFEVLSINVTNTIYVSETHIFYDIDSVIKFRKSDNWNKSYTLDTFNEYVFVSNYDCSTLLISEDKTLKIYRYLKNNYILIKTIQFIDPILEVKLNTLGNLGTVKTLQKLFLLK